MIIIQYLQQGILDGVILNFFVDFSHFFQCAIIFSPIVILHLNFRINETKQASERKAEQYFWVQHKKNWNIFHGFCFSTLIFLFTEIKFYSSFDFLFVSFSLFFFFSFQQHSYKVTCAADYKKAHPHSYNLQASFRTEIGQKLVTYTINSAKHFSITIIIEAQ